LFITQLPALADDRGIEVTRSDGGAVARIQRPLRWRVTTTPQTKNAKLLFTLVRYVGADNEPRDSAPR